MLLLQLVGLSIGYVVELLHSTGIDLRREDAIVLVNDDVDDTLKLPWKKTMAAEHNKELPLVIEHLDAVLHPVSNPDVTVAIDGNALGTGEVAGAVTVLAISRNELALGIEDLNAVVEGVADIKIAF